MFKLHFKLIMVINNYFKLQYIQLFLSQK